MGADAEAENSVLKWLQVWNTNVNSNILVIKSWILNARNGVGSGWNEPAATSAPGWGHSSCFGDELETHPLPLPKDFSALFSTPKFSPPTSLTLFLAHSIARAWDSSSTWLAQSFEEKRDTRLEEGGELNVEGMWKGEGKRSASSQTQKREKKGKLPPFFAFYFFSMFFFLLFYLRRRRWRPLSSSSSFVFLFLIEMKKATT
jgi:hypothetical protein